MRVEARQVAENAAADFVAFDANIERFSDDDVAIEFGLDGGVEVDPLGSESGRREDASAISASKRARRFTRRCSRSARCDHPRW